MGETKRTKKILLRFFRGELDETPSKGPFTEHECSSRVIAKFPDIRKKHIKKALRKLLCKGYIACIDRNGDKLYSISSTNDSIVNNDDDGGEDSEGSHKDLQDLKDNEVDREEIPFAELMRQKAATALIQPQTSPVKKMVRFSQQSEEDSDIDERIRRLERELEEDDSDNDSTYDGDDGDDEDGRNGDVVTDEPVITGDAMNNAESNILSFSTLADDRIEALPAACLPQAGTSKRLFGAVDAKNSDESTANVPIKKTKRDDKKQQVSKGLQEAVQEVLNGYVARSSERLPFYCRFCAKQYGNEREFLKHKKEIFHKTAVEMEQRATYCRLCHKQLTSPAQMQEHLKSRPHHERLQRVKQKQSGGTRQAFNTYKSGRTSSQGGSRRAQNPRRG